MAQEIECRVCDFENARHVARATWLCPVCGRDFSLEYLFWYRAAHPEVEERINQLSKKTD